MEEHIGVWRRRLQRSSLDSIVEFVIVRVGDDQERTLSQL